jgi:hypothetical protein
MKRSILGVVAAAAVASLVGATAEAQQVGAGAQKACYRTHCGKSIKGHEGQCGGTKVEGLKDEASCTKAGGAWTTEKDAEKYKEKE